MELTQELVKSFFHYHEDGYLLWINRPAQHMRAGQRAGGYNKRYNKYYIKISSVLYGAARLIFLWHKGYLPKEVDHEDRNSANDKIGNLRDADRSKNCANRRPFKNSSSKYKGVHWHRDRVWIAQIQINGKQTYIGSFKDEKKAALAYNREAVKHFKEYAYINVVTP